MKKLLSLILCAVLLTSVLVPSVLADGSIACLGSEAGDANDDGKTNSKDVAAMLKFFAGFSLTINTDKADVNRDGKANGKDAASVMKYIAGWSSVRLGHADTLVRTVEPTCTAQGFGYLVCSICGSTTDTVAIAPLGHRETKEVISEPGCVIDGMNTYTCTVCGNVRVGTVPATGHTTKTTTVKPTCIADGSKTTVCTTCGQTVSNTVLPRTGHNIVKGVCKNCGLSKTKANNNAFVWLRDYLKKNGTLNDDGSMYVVVSFVSEENGFMNTVSYDIKSGDIYAYVFVENSGSSSDEYFGLYMTDKGKTSFPETYFGGALLLNSGELAYFDDTVCDQTKLSSAGTLSIPGAHLEDGTLINFIVDPDPTLYSNAASVIYGIDFLFATNDTGYTVTDLGFFGFELDRS